MISQALAGLFLLALYGAPAVYTGRVSALDGHDASGSVRVSVEESVATITFGRDFRSERGPDVHVYLSRSPNYRKGDLVYVAKLQRARGAQRYSVRIQGDSRVSHVIVWCKKFDVGIARAPLSPAAS